MAREQGKVGQGKSAIVAQLPVACMNEIAATEFMEAQRWPDRPFCVHCGSTNVYKMIDAKTGERNKRFLWRCHECKKQYTVRIGTVFESTRIPLRHWCYAFWRASTSKKGAAALEIKRHTGLSYKSSLFMMHRIRLAMTPAKPVKLSGIVEVDETYVGGKPPKFRNYEKGKGRWSEKTPVLALVERAGNVHARPISRVSSTNLGNAIKELVDVENSTLMTDEWKAYRRVGKAFKGGHESVNHGLLEYARGNAHINTAESFFAIVKRGLYGVYHSVSKKHLHRYMNEFAFRFNGRKLEDGERTVAAIRGAEGKRLFYRPPAA